MSEFIKLKKIIKCPECNGKGYTIFTFSSIGSLDLFKQFNDCFRCNGIGKITLKVIDSRVKCKTKIQEQDLK